MYTIKGPITFKKGELPKKMEDHIEKHGMFSPFAEAVNFICTKMKEIKHRKKGEKVKPEKPIPKRVMAP